MRLVLFSAAAIASYILLMQVSEAAAQGLDECDYYHVHDGTRVNQGTPLAGTYHAMTSDQIHQFQLSRPHQLGSCLLCRSGRVCLVIDQGPPGQSTATPTPVAPPRTPSDSNCPQVIPAARAVSNAIQGGSRATDLFTNLDHTLVHCPPSWPRPIQCWDMMVDAMSKIGTDDPAYSRRRAQEALACYETGAGTKGEPGTRTAGNEGHSGDEGEECGPPITADSPSQRSDLSGKGPILADYQIAQTGDLPLGPRRGCRPVVSGDFSGKLRWSEYVRENGLRIHRVGNCTFDIHFDENGNGVGVFYYRNEDTSTPFANQMQVTVTVTRSPIKLPLAGKVTFFKNDNNEYVFDAPVPPYQADSETHTYTNFRGPWEEQENSPTLGDPRSITCLSNNVPGLKSLRYTSPQEIVVAAQKMRDMDLQITKGFLLLSWNFVIRNKTVVIR